MKGLEAALRELGMLEIRLGKMYGLKRIGRDDFDRLSAKIVDLKADLEQTEELNGIKFGDPDNQTPWTPERLKREGLG